MIPNAQVIVNKLLVHSEGLDDPEKYVAWLMAKASAGELRNTSFGAAISTSGDEMIEINAQELGLDINTRLIKDQLERDLALIEANGMSILRRMGLYLSDEGHGVDGDRVMSAWISVDSEDKARELAATVLSLAHDQHNEPARTSSGTLNNLSPEADRLIYQNVSDWGQRLIEVMIYFFDTERLAAWASAAGADIGESLNPDDPESFIKALKPKLNKRVLTGLKVPDWRTLVGKNNEVQGWLRAPDPTEKYGRKDAWMVAVAPSNNEYHFFPTEQEAIAWAEERCESPLMVFESTDPDDPEMFIKQFLPAWRLLSHVKNHHFYFIDDFNRVAVADYSMENQRDPASAEDGLLVLLKEKPIVKFKLHRLGDFHYSIRVRQDRSGKEMSVSANTTEFTDLWPKLEPLGFTLQIKEGLDDPSPDVLNTLAPVGVTPEQHNALRARGFVYSSRWSSGANEYQRQMGKHKILLVGTSDNQWSLADYYRGGASHERGTFDQMMAQFDAWKAQFDRRSRKVAEGVDDELSPEYYLQATTGWIDTFLNAGMKNDPTTNMAGRFVKKYDLHGYHYNLWISTRNPMWMIAERNDSLYGTNVYRRVFEYPDGDKTGLVKEFTAVDRLLSKAPHVLWSTYSTIDEKIGKLHTKHLGRRQKWLSGRIKEAVNVTTELVDPETFIKDVFCGPVLEALDVDLPPEDDPEAFTKHFVDKDLGATFEIIRSGTNGIYADERFRNDWLVYSDDKEPEPGRQSRSFEGYLRNEGNGWRPFDRLNSTEALPLPRFYQTQEEAAYALYMHNQTAYARFKSKRPAQEAIELPPEDEPTGHEIDQSFNVDDILRGYERVRVNNNWFKVIRFAHPLRLDMEIIVRRRGHATEDNADTLYDIDILKSTDDKTGFVHLTTGYTIPLIKLREAVKLAERSATQGHYGEFERRYGLTRNFQEGLDDPDPQAYLDKLGTEPIPNAHKQAKPVASWDEGIRYVMTDYEQALGKSFQVPYIIGYDNESNSHDCAGPWTVKIIHTDMESIRHVNGTHEGTYFDPYWNVEVLSGTPENEGFLKTVPHHHWIDGPSYFLPKKVQEAEMPVPIPPEDEPGDVLATHEKGLFLPELKRLGFQQGNDKEEVDLYGEKVPRYWYKGYTAADGKTHAVYTYLMRCLSGGAPDLKFNIYDEDSKQWWPQNKGEMQLHPQTTAQAAACLREVDAAMARSAEMSLPPDQEWASLQRIVSHYSKWYWNALYPPGQPVLNVNPQE